MKNLKYVILVLGLIMLAWLLPALYELVLPRTGKMPFVVYSCLDSTFIKMEVQDKQVHYIDFRGQEFNKHHDRYGCAWNGIIGENRFDETGKTTYHQDGKKAQEKALVPTVDPGHDSGEPQSHHT